MLSSLIFYILLNLYEINGFLMWNNSLYPWKFLHNDIPVTQVKMLFFCFLTYMFANETAGFKCKRREIRIKSPIYLLGFLV